MSGFSKRKRCDDCGDTFSTQQVFQRHKVSCAAPVSDVEEDDLSQDSDSDEECYINEDDIEDLLKSFEPKANIPDSSADQSRPFVKAVVIWTCLFLCLWQSAFYISSSAISVLLQYIHALLTVAAEHFKILSVVIPIFPSSIYMLHKLLKIDNNNFVHYVVCPACYSLYTFSDCVTVVEGEEISKSCQFISQPNHPMVHHRRPCGRQLLKTVLLPSGKKKLVPFKNYYYKPLKNSLSDLISRPGFEKKCDHWRKRNINESTLHDVYDGNIWKSFSETFFNCKRNYGLMLNLDWFQPFKHVKYSVGVMYLVVLNLPRHERFRRENVIIVSVIPHMKKEPATNSFVQPLVDDLLEAWTIGYRLGSGLQHNIYRLALLCIGCDIPACRKLCGFLGHSAVQGCSRCKKSFPGSFGNRDYSGFKREEWPKRSHKDHIRQIREITACNTKGMREQLESKYGSRYSVLSELPYIDIIKMSIVDPMHNLFLGTTKHMLHIWKDTGVLSDRDFDSIQQRVDSIECPSDIGRIPHKISSGFSGFNADQFKNWTVLFSVYALKDIIADEHLECWRLFVLACRILCCQSITLTNLKVADTLLMKFCCLFEHLYGKARVTPNMHLHGHLADCVLDFGPIYSFWLFSFERFNGMLGDIPTNKKNIELQLMRRFLCHSHLLGLAMTDEFQLAASLDPILNQVSYKSNVGTLASINASDESCLRQFSSRLQNPEDLDWSSIDIYKFSKFKVQCLTSTDHVHMSAMYRLMYTSETELMPAYREIKTLYLGNEILGSAKGQSSRSSYISAYWTDDNGEINWGFIHDLAGSCDFCSMQ